MVELVLKITARASGMSAMIQALTAVMFQAKLERACVDCQLYAEIGNPQSLRYVEAWATPRDMESQLRSNRFGMLLAIMETAPQAPDLEVRTVSEQRGLEYVCAIRLESVAHGGRGMCDPNIHSIKRQQNNEQCIYEKKKTTQQ